MGSKKRDAFDASFLHFDNTGPNPFDTSFESDPFEFSASSAQYTEEDAPVYFDDPFAAPETARVVVHEQVSALYDDVSQDGGTVAVEGSVHVQTGLKKPFCLVLRDKMDNLVRCDEEDGVCQNVSNKVSRKGLRRTDRVFRLQQLPNNVRTCVLHYVCAPSLRPVPLLIKSRTRVTKEYTRLGFKIRANPSNEFPLRRIVVMLAVPPNMDGQSVRMSREGGMWDEMKRTLSWSVQKLEPGAALEIQAQFQAVDGGAMAMSERSSLFPVLARCDYPHLFSQVEIHSDFVDSMSSPVKLSVKASARVLHRKV